MIKTGAVVIDVTSTSALDTAAAVVAEPVDERRATLGTFFALLKVDDINTVVSWVQPFLEFLEATYYQAEGSLTAGSIERAVSLTRQRAKGKLQQLVRESRLPGLGHVHFVLGAMRGQNVVVSHGGTAQAYLLHQLRTSTDGRPRYRWLDITKTTGPRNGGAEPAATILAGEIGPEDTLLVCTESVTEALGLEKLQRAFAHLSLDGVRTALVKELRAIGGRRSYAAAALRPQRPGEGQPAAATSSMATLRERETGTTSLLTAPSQRPWKRLWQMATSRPRPPAAASPEPATAAGRGRPGRRTTSAWHAGRGFRRLFDSVISGTAHAIVLTLRLAAHVATAEGRTAVAAASRRSYDSGVSRIVEAVRVLPRSSQRLLITSLLLGFLFVQSLVFLARRQLQEASFANDVKRVAEIQQRLDRIESDLVFGDDAEAVTLLAEVQEMAATLPNATNEQRRRSALLAATIGELRAELDRVIEISDPATVAAVPAEQFGEPDGFVFTGGKLLLFRGATNTFAVADPATGATTVQPITAANIGHIERGVADDPSHLAVFLAGRGIAALDLSTQSLTGLTVEDPPAHAQDLAVYQNRLYLLDAERQQVWRYQRTASGYGRRSPWVRGVVEGMPTATALAVDGSVYILLRDGAVRRLQSGTLQDWRTQPLLAATGNATKLVAPTGSKSLYALDAAANRIFVWERERGRLQAQYVLSTDRPVKDIAVDEPAGVIYALSGGRIFKVPLRRP